MIQWSPSLLLGMHMYGRFIQCERSRVDPQKPVPCAFARILLLASPPDQAQSEHRAVTPTEMQQWPPSVSTFGGIFALGILDYCARSRAAGHSLAPTCEMLIPAFLSLCPQQTGRRQHPSSNSCREIMGRLCTSVFPRHLLRCTKAAFSWFPAS